MDHEFTAHYVMPLYDFRLGTLSLTAGLYAVQAGGDFNSGSAAGLGMAGVNVQLFPLRRFPMSFFIEKSSRSASGTLSGFNSTATGGTLLLKTNLFGYWWFTGQRQRYTYRYGDFNQTNSWDSWTVRQNRTFGKRLRGDFWWQSDSRTYSGETSDSQRGSYYLYSPLANGGRFTTTTNYIKDSGRWGSGRSLAGQAALDIGFKQALHAVSVVDYQTYKNSTGTSGQFEAASAMMTFKKANWTYLVGASASQANQETFNASVVEKLAQSSQQVSAGVAWAPHTEWIVSADAAMGGLNSSRGEERGNSSLKTLHMGVAYQDGVPSWASRLAYSFRTLAFERGLVEAFPPGYQSAELLSIRENYYNRIGSGKFSFHADAYLNQQASGTSDTAFLGGLRFGFNTELSLEVGTQYRHSKFQSEQATGTSTGDSQFSMIYGNLQYQGEGGHTIGVYLSLTQSKSTDNLNVLRPGTSQNGARLGLTWSRSLFGTMPLTARLIYDSNSSWGATYWVDVTSTMPWRQATFRWAYTYEFSEYGWGNGEPIKTHRLRMDIWRLIRGSR